MSIRKNSQFIGVCITLVAAFLVILSGCTEKEITEKQYWRFALEEIQGSVQDAYAQKFAELIEKRSNGKINVKIYPYGTLGTSDQITELVATGALQFAMSSPGHLGKIIPELQVFALHFILSGEAEKDKKLLSSEPLIRLFRQLYKEKGFRLLSFYPEGWQAWTTNRKITEPDDFKGFKMRVMTSPLLIQSYRAYGASPVPLPYSEIYSALQLKMIDGQVNPVFAIEEMSFDEVSEYLIFPGASQFVTSAIASQRFYERLPDEQKQWIDETMDELQDYIFKVQSEFNKERLETIKERNKDIEIIYLSDEQKKAFEKAAQPVRKKYLEIGGDKAEEVLAIFERAKKQKTGEPAQPSGKDSSPKAQ